MNADEQFVREKWERVIVCDGSYRHYSKGTILLNWANHQFYEFETWSAARAFTEQRLEEIRQVEEEITLIQPFVLHTFNPDIWQRILTREQAALDALRKGTKP